MASRKKTTRRPSVKSHAATNGSDELPANGTTPTPNGSDQGEQIAYPGVVIMRVPGENPGEENIQLMEVNGMDPLAVPTLLRVAANIKSQQLGLGD